MLVLREGGVSQISWISHIYVFLGGLVIGNDTKKQIRWLHELPEECCSAQNLRLFHSI